MNATTPDEASRTGSSSTAPADQEPEAIARGIDATRGQVNRTLNALQAKLSPGQILDQALDFARNTGGEFAINLGRSMKQNPMPVVLTGIGLVWMMAARNSPQPSGGRARVADGAPIGERVGEARERISNKASELASAAREHISGAADRLSDAAGTVSDSLTGATQTLSSQAHRAREGFAQLLEEQPLLVGALGIALGAIVGYALPATDTEDRLLGEARDRTVDAVKEAGAEQYAKANEFATQMTEAREGSSREPH